MSSVAMSLPVSFGWGKGELTNFGHPAVGWGSRGTPRWTSCGQTGPCLVGLSDRFSLSCLRSRRADNKRARPCTPFGPQTPDLKLRSRRGRVRPNRDQGIAFDIENSIEAGKGRRSIAQMQITERVIKSTPAPHDPSLSLAPSLAELWPPPSTLRSPPSTYADHTSIHTTLRIFRVHELHPPQTLNVHPTTLQICPPARGLPRLPKRGR